MRVLLTMFLLTTLAARALSATCAGTCGVVDGSNGCSVPAAGICTVTADNKTCDVNNGTGVTQFVAAKETTGNWDSFLLTPPMAVTVDCSAPAASCASTTGSWLSNCSGGLPLTASGIETTVANTASGYTGSATFRCDNGVWSAPASATCSADSGCTVTVPVSYVSGGCTCKTGLNAGTKSYPIGITSFITTNSTSDCGGQPQNEGTYEINCPSNGGTATITRDCTAMQ